MVLVLVRTCGVACCGCVVMPGGDFGSQRAPAPGCGHLRHHEPGIRRQVTIRLLISSTLVYIYAIRVEG